MMIVVGGNLVACVHDGGEVEKHDHKYYEATAGRQGPICILTA